MVPKASVVIVKHKIEPDTFLGIKTRKRKLVEFPGGKIDEGETPLSAAIRECIEETGIRMQDPIYYIGDYFDGSYMCSVYYTENYTGFVTNSIEGEAGWFHKRAFLTGAYPEWSKKKFEMLKALNL